MKVLICEETRPLLEEYHDDELPVGDQIAVRAHLEWCDECSAVFTDLRLMRGVVRAVARGQSLLDQEDRITFQAGVISRARAEERVSWPVRLREVLDDMHIVYAGVGAAAATVFCVLILMSMMRFATQERPDSLAAIVSLLAAPKTAPVDENAPGTNRNPVVVDARMLMPRALDQLFLAAASATDESAFTLSAVVTREGRLVNLEWHSPSGRPPKAGSRERETVDTLLSTASLARFEPARVQGLPVAVNMIWLVANTTVRAPKAALDLPVPAPLADGAPAPRKRRAEFVLPTPSRRTTAA
ncbi:MAG TPA: anti-sigma factor [Vicinamibacterales bacterium]|nr:anti-sigma factor [Vicinamibacterales bacterium]